MTNDQALLASMENNTIIGIFLIVLVIWYLSYVFGKDSKPKKYLVDEDDIAEDDQYMNKGELVEILHQFYNSSTNKFKLPKYSEPWKINKIIEEWADLRVFNQETK